VAMVMNISFCRMESRRSNSLILARVTRIKAGPGLTTLN